MKRYVRTKDGKIIDTSKYLKHFDDNKRLWVSFDNGLSFTDCGIKPKQADTIEDLFFLNDLVITEFNEAHIINETINNLRTHIFTELYTKQGNNFILVARKENGEWRVL